MGACGMTSAKSRRASKELERYDCCDLQNQRHIGRGFCADAAKSDGFVMFSRRQGSPERMVKLQSFILQASHRGDHSDLQDFCAMAPVSKESVSV